MNLMQKNPRLCVVERGAVGRLGRILVPWGYWGEDGKIGSKWLLGNLWNQLLERWWPYIRISTWMYDES